MKKKFDLAELEHAYAGSAGHGRSPSIKVHVYLNFRGNAAEAFEFYRSLFGGELSSHVRFRDMPMEGVDIPEADQDKAMHIALPIGEDNVLMASDALESLGQQLQRGNNVYVSVHPDTREDADRIFKGLSAGGEVEMPIADQVWGDYCVPRSSGTVNEEVSASESGMTERKLVVASG